ncbi:hypothetical protein [Rhizobium leguminosarum]|uniref:hypothetical protein n=1 Tax=Rhizobium leguminosarum TaxID=384 RepID=UPI002FEFE45C
MSGADKFLVDQLQNEFQAIKQACVSLATQALLANPCPSSEAFNTERDTEFFGPPCIIVRFDRIKLFEAG